jgi:hypothetical protein
MMNNTPIRLGSVSAHIPGDLRYFDKLTAQLTGDSPWAMIQIVVQENGALGGMDSFGGTSEYSRGVLAEMGRNVTAAELVAEIKRVINRSDSLIKRYGKPSKNFSWSAFGLKGLNVKNAAIILKNAPILVSKPINDSAVQ